MQLFMQGAGGKPQDLPANDNSIDTGFMSDCVSVIVLYNHDSAQNRYSNGRGWHGLGGVQVIDMAAMMAGVHNFNTTKVIIIPGSLGQSDFSKDMNLEHVRAGLTAHPNVDVLYIKGHSQATVDRQGSVTQSQQSQTSLDSQVGASEYSSGVSGEV